MEPSDLLQKGTASSQYIQPPAPRLKPQHQKVSFENPDDVMMMFCAFRLPISKQELMLNFS